VKRFVGILLVVGIAVVFLNDAGRWVNSQSQLNEKTAQLAEWAATNVKDQSRDSGSRTVAGEGAAQGVHVYQYDQDQTTVRIWSSLDVPGTWVVGPYVAISRGTPLAQAFGVPFVVRSYQQAQFQ
jgi:hypothetical protein